MQPFGLCRVLCGPFLVKVFWQLKTFWQLSNYEEVRRNHWLVSSSMRSMFG
jgi:hypothetical protein